jgi:prepilin-type N-terminal cleavage/methylation domain-containing protein
MKKIINKIKSAFSLLELSIVIMISGIILYSTLEMYDYFLNVDTYKQTNVKLAKIQTSLQNFFNKYGRLPCPADPTLLVSDANFGKESVNADYTCNSRNYEAGGADATIYNRGFANTRLYRYSSNANSAVSHRIIFGAIPFKTLGLQDDMMFDNYGNKFTYLAMEGYAIDRLKTPILAYKNMSWSRVSIPGRSSTDSTCVDSYTRLVPNIKNFDTATGKGCLQGYTDASVGGIRFDCNLEGVIGLVSKGPNYNTDILSSDHNMITGCHVDVYSYSGSNLTQGEFAYSVTSHGKNGSGAWNRYGKLNPISMVETPANATKEQKNAYYYNAYNRWDQIIAYYDTTNSTENGYALGSSTYSGQVLGSIQIYQSTSPTTDFDDQVVYGSIRDLLTNAGLINSVACHQSTLYLDIPSYTTPNRSTNILFLPPTSDINVVFNPNITKSITSYQYNGSISTANAYCNPGGKWSVAP